jgi:type VI protein secretion system component VasA
MQDDILEYYRRELLYLRTQSADFAARYPKVAQRLVLTGAESPDPHTERLIEAVAFLTARVHRDLDRDFPTVAAAMLDNLCPSLTQPVPAMTVVQMTLDSSQGKVTAGMPVTCGTMLSTTASSGENCRFQVGWDTTLGPCTISDYQAFGGKGQGRSGKADHRFDPLRHVDHQLRARQGKFARQHEHRIKDQCQRRHTPHQLGNLLGDGGRLAGLFDPDPGQSDTQQRT